MVFSPDSQLVASVTGKIVKIWDTSTGALYIALGGHAGTVCAVAFSPDGQLLATGSFSGTVRLWNVTTGINCNILKGHSGTISTVAFTPNGRYLVSRSSDGIVTLWDPRTGGVCATIDGDIDGWYGPYSMAISPNSRLLAIFGNGAITLWDIEAKTSSNTVSYRSLPNTVLSFSPDSGLLASTCRDYTVRLWNTVTGALQGILPGQPGLSKVLVFSPDGQTLATGWSERMVRLWDVNTRESYAILNGSFVASNSCVAFSPKWPIFVVHIRSPRYLSLECENRGVTWNVYRPCGSYHRGDVFTGWKVSCFVIQRRKRPPLGSKD